jgi:hypothetical protein
VLHLPARLLLGPGFDTCTIMTSADDFSSASLDAFGLKPKARDMVWKHHHPLRNLILSN